MPDPSGGGDDPDQTDESSAGRGPILAAPELAMAAEVLDDLEKVWIANANRLRILTRSEADSDGEVRGFGLDEQHPSVARLAAMVAALDKLTVDATRNLEALMRQHPLGPWVKGQKGLGNKQVARLLAAVGDPCWHSLYDRPRRLAELRAYCGLHVVPAGHATAGAQGRIAGREELAGGDTDHWNGDEPQARPVGVAPRRQRGRQSNWNETARKRLWLIAGSCVKAGGPYREVYDEAKVKYADAVHLVPCVRCGPTGHPAPAGSPLSKGHVHARGLRAIMRAVVKDLWQESRRLHGYDEGPAVRPEPTNSADDHLISDLAGSSPKPSSADQPDRKHWANPRPSANGRFGYNVGWRRT